MQYILQVGTGGFNHKTTDYDKIEKRLKFCFDSIDVKSVLLGWAIDKEIYDKVYNLVKEYGKEVYLWLPVFSEISDVVKTEPTVDFKGNPMKSINVADGENFNFVCPSSDFNVKQVEYIFKEYFKKENFDGVFVDKIRYASFGNGFDAAMGCFCNNCRLIYEKNGIDVEKLISMLNSDDRRFLLPTKFESCKYEFKDEIINRFYKVKSEIITESIKKLCNYFRANGLKVAFDVLAPVASYLAGQDILELSKYAEFIKPMMYRCSEDPAGIRYEYRNIIEQIGEANANEFDRYFLTLFGTENVLSDEFLVRQYKMMRGASCSISQGIEINKNAKMLRSNEQYVARNVKIAEDYGFDSVVLSWDVTTAPIGHIECLKGEKI